MIGDSYEADIVGARNSGIDQVWFNPHRDGKKGEATYQITKLNGAMKML